MSNYTEVIGNMPNQFKASGSGIAWKHEEIHIAGNTLVTVHFDSTKPNMFMLQNPNNTVIHVGIKRIPSAKNYEFKIEMNSSATFGTPHATDRIYLLNKGSAEVTVSLFSVFDKFDMSILQTLSVDLSKTPVFDGIINGFGNGVSLPSGTNKIGKVEVSNLQDLMTILQNLGGEASKLAKSFETFNMTDTNEITRNFASEYKNIEGISFISNDGENDMNVTIYNENSKSCIIPLKAGEVINDLHMKISKVVFSPVEAETITFRSLFIER